MSADVGVDSNSLTPSLDEHGTRITPEPAPEKSPQKRRAIAEGYLDRTLPTSPQGSTQQVRKVITSETKHPDDIIEGCRFPVTPQCPAEVWKLTVKKFVELSLHSDNETFFVIAAGLDTTGAFRVDPDVPQKEVDQWRGKELASIDASRATALLDNLGRYCSDGNYHGTVVLPTAGCGQITHLSVQFRLHSEPLPRFFDGDPDQRRFFAAMSVAYRFPSVVVACSRGEVAILSHSEIRAARGPRRMFLTSLAAASGPGGSTLTTVAKPQTLMKIPDPVVIEGLTSDKKLADRVISLLDLRSQSEFSETIKKCAEQLTKGKGGVVLVVFDKNYKNSLPFSYLDGGLLTEAIRKTAGNLNNDPHSFQTMLEKFCAHTDSDRWERPLIEELAIQLKAKELLNSKRLPNGLARQLKEQEPLTMKDLPKELAEELMADDDVQMLMKMNGAPKDGGLLMSLGGTVLSAAAQIKQFASRWRIVKPDGSEHGTRHAAAVGAVEWMADKRIMGVVFVRSDSGGLHTLVPWRPPMDTSKSLVKLFYVPHEGRRKNSTPEECFQMSRAYDRLQEEGFDDGKCCNMYDAVRFTFTPNFAFSVKGVEYKVLRELSPCGCGVMFEVRQVATKTRFAARVIGKDYASRLRREMALLSSLAEEGAVFVPSLVGLGEGVIDSSTRKGFLVLLMERASGSLEEAVATKSCSGGKLQQISYIVWHMLQMMHDRCFLFPGVKLSSVFISVAGTDSVECWPVLAEFGSALSAFDSDKAFKRASLSLQEKRVDFRAWAQLTRQLFQGREDASDVPPDFWPCVDSVDDTSIEDGQCVKDVKDQMRQMFEERFEGWKRKRSEELAGQFRDNLSESKREAEELERSVTKELESRAACRTQ